MSLLSVSECRALINTSLTDNQLQAVIDRAEAEVTVRVGAPQNNDGTVSNTFTLSGGLPHLFLPAEIASVVSVNANGVMLTADEYQIRVGGMLERKPFTKLWEDPVTVVVRLRDDRAERKTVIIDLVRLDLNRTAFQAESVGGEYSYSAFGWERERTRILRRLQYPLG